MIHMIQRNFYLGKKDADRLDRLAMLKHLPTATYARILVLDGMEEDEDRIAAK